MVFVGANRGKAMDPKWSIGLEQQLGAFKIALVAVQESPCGMNQHFVTKLWWLMPKATKERSRS